MIPSAIQRGNARSGLHFSLPLLIAAVVGALIALLALWVLLTMGAPPTPTPVEQDIAVHL